MGGKASSCCSSSDPNVHVFDMIRQDNSCRGIVEETQSLAVAIGVVEDPDDPSHTSVFDMSDINPEPRLVKAVSDDDGTAVLEHVAEGADFVELGKALRLAAMKGKCTVVRELAAIGLAVNEECPSTGFTALQLAAAHGHTTACELLLDVMADVLQCNRMAGREGDSALSIARRAGNDEVVTLLEQHLPKTINNEDQNTEGPLSSSPQSTLHVMPRVSQHLSDVVVSHLRQAQLPAVAMKRRTPTGSGHLLTPATLRDNVIHEESGENASLGEDVASTPGSDTRTKVEVAHVLESAGGKTATPSSDTHMSAITSRPDDNVQL